MKLSANLEAIDPEKFPGYVQAIYGMMTTSSSYVTTGEYFMHLYDEDLQDLLDAIAKITVPAGLEDPTAVENIMMLAILLRTAEGAPDMSEDELHSSIAFTCSFAAMEKLYRMGKVELFRENMSIAIDGNEASKRLIARKIEDD